MSTRSRDQQKKQRQKEFKERKEHQELLKVAAEKAKRDSSRNEDETDGMSKIED
jgi:translation initiation factor 2 alpha subunit (eIF-2alpha)